MAPSTGTPKRYAEEIGELWDGLSATLGKLDRLAAEPGRLDDEVVDHALPRLQYRLHLAAEHAYGVEPPAGAATAHAELADALAGARDATGEVVETIADWGTDGVGHVLHRWRGALFRVRLARLRLAAPAVERAERDDAPGEGIGRPLAAFLLALFGALACAAGAVLGAWPVWAAGVVAVVASVLAYRP